MFPDPGCVNATMSNILAALETTQQFQIKYASDSNPEMCSSITLANYGGQFPAGTSFKSFDHFLQIHLSKEFKMYDYGSPELNGKHYGGQAVPPSYPTEKLQDFPIALITGKTDMLSAPGDYNNLKEMLES